MTRQQHAADALIRAAREAIAALLLLLTVLAALLVQIIAQVLNFLAMFARPIVYVLMVGSVVVAIYVALPAVYAAYGGDVPALLPAIVICLLPIVISLGSGKGAWTLFGAAGEIYGAGVLIQSADLPARGAIVSTAIAAIVAYQILNMEKERDEKNTMVDPAGHSEAGAVVVHSESDTGPVSTDPGP